MTEPRAVEPAVVLEIWYDGACGLCRRSRQWVERRSPAGAVRLVDFRAAPADRLPVPLPSLESSMWVRTREGRLLHGFAGWCAILELLPRWRWLARLCGLPPLRWLGPSAYRVVARLRHRLPGAATACRNRGACQGSR